MQNNKSSEFQALAKQEQNIIGKLIFQKMSVEDYMADYKLGHPSVYVGTYRKYNEGDLFGMWVDMEACGDYDTFMEVCHNLHADEEDPELMFQDYENFPEAWYSESGIDEDTFDKIMEYAGMDEDDQEAFDAYMDYSSQPTFEDFKEKFMGKWDSEEAFAEHIVSECYDLDRMMGRLSYYFDYKAYARDLFIEDYYYSDGYVFQR